MIAKACVVLAALSAPAVFADTFKCVSPQGAISFASQPCVPGGGQTSVVPPPTEMNLVKAQPAPPLPPGSHTVVTRTFTHYQQLHVEFHRGAQPPSTVVPKVNDD